jgi:hypothetical protein
MNMKASCILLENKFLAYLGDRPSIKDISKFLEGRGQTLLKNLSTNRSKKVQTWVKGVSKFSKTLLMSFTDEIYFRETSQNFSSFRQPIEKTEITVV